MALRRALWRRGLRYRLHRKDLPGCPDIVFPGHRVAVFVDGDFWHGRDWPSRKEALRRGSNAAYWVEKIESNMARDRRQEAKLTRSGWTVVRLWETDVLMSPDRAAEAVTVYLGARPPEGCSEQ